LFFGLLFYVGAALSGAVHNAANVAAAGLVNLSAVVVVGMITDQRASPNYVQRSFSSFLPVSLYSFPRLEFMHPSKSQPSWKHQILSFQM